jgi:hypothetical protein
MLIYFDLIYIDVYPFAFLFIFDINAFIPSIYLHFYYIFTSVCISQTCLKKNAKHFWGYGLWAMGYRLLNIIFWVFLLGWFRVARYVLRVLGQGFEAFS